MPAEWAVTMMNLGIAYANRIRGDRADNLEQAIAACEQAMTVMTQDKMPMWWATILLNLTTIYADRIRGNRADNLEQAIAACEQAMTVMTQDKMPTEWVAASTNLATAYLSRIRGDRVENIEQAITAYQQALAVTTLHNMPEQWATILHNLANAYSELIKGNRVENIEQSILAYQQAITVRTQQTSPIKWSETALDLSSVYAKRTKGNKAENLELAININKQVLGVRTQDAMPIEWAHALNNLASLYAARIRGDKAENLEQAISAYEQVLEVRTQDAMPIEWAETLHNLASVYMKRVRGNKAENLELAINALQQSLTVFQPELLPNRCRNTAWVLASMYSKQLDWSSAAVIYEKALKSAEILYQSAALLESKSSVLYKTTGLSHQAAIAYTHIDNSVEAIKTIERGRARILSESLERDRANLADLKQVHSVLYNQYSTLVEQLRLLENQQRERAISIDRNSTTPKSLSDSATALNQQLNTLIQDIRRVPDYENFLALPTFEDVQQAVHDNCPLIYLLSTPAGSLALVVTSQDIQSIWLDGLKEEELIETLNKKWFSAYSQSQSNRQAWLGAIDSVTRQLWESLVQPLIHYLRTYSFNQAILIPTGYLSLLPLHAAWTEDETRPSGRRYAIDDIHFTYAPNAKSLNAARMLAHRIQPDSILAIDNPRNDLPNSEREVNAAVDSFSDRTLLSHQSATVAAVKTQLSEHTVVHFSCHGTANLTEPLNSSLLMHDGPLTLKDIFALNLAESGGLRLAILSACETGMIGIENADEAISLPTGLLQAGVAAVIASLWSVDDLSTMMLLTRFYDLWRTEGLEISQALRQAQQWVRDTTNGEKTAYFKDFMPTQSAAKMPASAADHLYKSLILSRPDARDFAHPFHWAAFSYIGA